MTRMLLFEDKVPENFSNSSDTTASSVFKFAAPFIKQNSMILFKQISLR